MAVVGFLAVAAPQVRSQDPDPMFLGLPNHYSALTDLSFYSSY